nr:hypothetical protein [Burkholderia gladioli]
MDPTPAAVEFTPSAVASACDAVDALPSAMAPVVVAIARRPTARLSSPVAVLPFPTAIASPFDAVALIPIAIGDAPEAVAVAPCPNAIAPFPAVPPFATAGRPEAGDIAIAPLPFAEPLPAAYCAWASRGSTARQIVPITQCRLRIETMGRSRKAAGAALAARLPTRSRCFAFASPTETQPCAIALKYLSAMENSIRI